MAPKAGWAPPRPRGNLPLRRPTAWDCMAHDRSWPAHSPNTFGPSKANDPNWIPRPWGSGAHSLTWCGPTAYLPEWCGWRPARANETLSAMDSIHEWMDSVPRFARIIGGPVTKCAPAPSDGALLDHLRAPCSSGPHQNTRCTRPFRKGAAPDTIGRWHETIRRNGWHDDDCP